MNENSRKILIIEDDHLVADIYKSKFEEAGYEVDVVYDGQAGFYRIHEIKPNVVLLDLTLPQINGLDILKKIRAQKRFDKLPIFVFTNSYLSKFAHEAAAAGANQVFDKGTTTPQHILDAANALLFLPPPTCQGARTPSHPVPSSDLPVSTRPQADSLGPTPSAPVSGEDDGAVRMELRNAFGAKSTVGKTVLIIEDDPITLSIFKDRIEEAGFTVETAVNGEEGLGAVQQLNPDVILLDLMLPRVDGIEFLKRIREQRQFKERPIFVFTNVYLSNLAKDAVKAGATQVFDKAVALPRDIIRAIRDFSGSRTDSSGSHRPASAQGKNNEAEPLGAGTDADLPGTGSQHELVQAFVETAPETFLGLRKILQALAKGDGSAARRTQLANLYEKVHTLSGGAAAAGLHFLSQLSAALEALLKQLTTKPDRLTPSSLRTLSHAMDFLDVLFKHDSPADPREASPLKILVVDDESISREAIVSALENAKLNSVDVDNPKVALQLLTESSFDLIFLDVSMPDMNGFDLCRELRKLPIHKTTPIIFVTRSIDFESRSQGALSGGNDLIAKPFLFTELAVKALNYALKNRFSQPDLSVREIAVTNQPKPKKPKAEVIVFGNHGEVLPPEPDYYTPRERKPSRSSSKQQPPAAALPESAFGVAESSFPSTSPRSNIDPAQSISADVTGAKAKPSRDAGATDQAESRGARVKKQSPEHAQVQAPRLKKSSESQPVESRCVELDKSWEAFTGDLNGQKQFEDALRESNHDLRLRLPSDTDLPPEADEEKETYADRDLASEAEWRKRDILADPSQKLRQPVDQILGMGDKLLGTPLTTEQRALVTSMQSRAEALLCLDQALPDRSRMAVAPVNPKSATFNLCSALEEATEEFAVDARQRKIELAVLVDQRVPEELQGDQNFLCKVLTLLIRPTLKLAKTGPVLLHVTKEKATQSSVTLRFVLRGFDLDRGQKFHGSWLQALAPGEQPKVGKYEDRELDVAGTQQLVGTVRGQSGIEVSADLSSSFWFNVQFTTAAESAPSPLAGLRALVVDQDQMKRDLLQARLQASGVECSTVANATDAPALLRRGLTSDDPFKVALIGGQLGEMSGLSLAKLVKGDLALADIALVIMQEETPGSQDELYRNAGIIACISEPLRQSRLFTILRKIACQG